MVNFKAYDIVKCEVYGFGRENKILPPQDGVSPMDPAFAGLTTKVDKYIKVNHVLDFLGFSPIGPLIGVLRIITSLSVWRDVDTTLDREAGHSAAKADGVAPAKEADEADDVHAEYRKIWEVHGIVQISRGVLEIFGLGWLNFLLGCGFTVHNWNWNIPFHYIQGRGFWASRAPVLM